MPNPSLHGDLITAARKEWRAALAEARPEKLFGPDYRAVWKKMEKDPRIAIDLMKIRRAMYVARGMQYDEADRVAKADLQKFKITYGGE